MCVQWYHRRFDNLLMKVQRDAVSENRSHNFRVSLRSWSGLGISYSLGKRDVIGYISVISTSSVL